MDDLDKILRLIENVDPADSAGMDEIDARVEVYLLNDLKNYLFEGRVVSPQEFIAVCRDLGCNTPNYTRSRDALKAIRPEGWHLNIEQEEYGFDCWLYGENTNFYGGNRDNDGALPTEELAELHAILQAIQHERQRDERNI